MRLRSQVLPGNLLRLLLAVLLAGSAGALLPGRADAIGILLVGSDPSPGVGDPFDVDVIVSGLTAGGSPSLKSFELDLLFDDGVLSFSSASFGTGLNGGNAASSIQDSGLRGAATDKAYIAEVSLLGNLNGQPASFLLGTFHFDVIGAGASSVSLGTNANPVSPLFGSATGQLLLLDALPAPVEFVAVPEPGTAGLLTAGVIGLTQWRSRRLLASRHRERLARSVRA